MSEVANDRTLVDPRGGGDMRSEFEIAFSVLGGAIMGWFLCALLMYSEVKRNCPSAEGVQCEYFGHTKVCVVSP
jgi:hypothetical protein